MILGLGNSRAFFLQIWFFVAVVGFYIGLFFATNGIPSAQKYLSVKFFLSVSPLALIYGFVSGAITLPFLLKVKYVATIWYFAAGLWLLFSAGALYVFFLWFLYRLETRVRCQEQE